MASFLSPTTPTINETRFSATPKRFRESTHLIPTPGAFKKAQRYDPIALWLPIVVGTPLIILGLAIALEVGIAISEKNGGFTVPAKNIFSIASQQFLLSFFPTLLIIPNAFLWRELDWFLRWYHPYVLLQKGNARAEESLLLDYVSTGPFLSVWYGLQYKHRIIFWSAVTAVLTYLLQPLAGSIFNIQQLPQSIPDVVTSVKQINLNDANIQDNTAFLASAGFVETAVFNQLPDPPFIQRKWSIAEFVFPPYPGFNGSVVVNTTAIQSDPHCANPTEAPETSKDPTTGSTIISANSQDGCTVKVSLDGQAATQQYGVVNIRQGSTGNCSNIEDVSKQPVMFWFFHDKDDGTAEAKAVFCSPTIKAYNVKASANLANNNLTTVVIGSDYLAANNVTGAPTNSLAFNGVVFNHSDNPFIQARANATNNGVPGAIFRLASQDKNGIQAVFDDPNGFLDKTTQVYTQHLALSAKGVYFVAVNQTIGGNDVLKTSFVPRLVINALAGHSLALIMILVGGIGVVVQLIFRRQRKNLMLAAEPGSIAAIVALTAHSGFGQLLLPYDNAEALEKKLRDLRFRLDQRTGAIVAEDTVLEENVMGWREDKDISRQSLLGHDAQSRPRSLSDMRSEQSLTRSQTSLVLSDSTTYINHGPSGLTEYRPMVYPPS